jgi:negative regulator of replication initiation
MTPTIRVDDDIWEHLKNNSTFVDTPNDVLRRLLNIPKKASKPVGAQAQTNSARYVLQADRDYANVPITSYEFEGKQTSVRTYKDVLLNVCETLRSRHGERFDKVALALHGKKRSYFASLDTGMKHPRRIAGRTDLYVESNLSATSIMGLCQHLTRALGHDIATFKVH